jgi:hypothetical protein
VIVLITPVLIDQALAPAPGWLEMATSPLPLPWLATSAHRPSVEQLTSAKPATWGSIPDAAVWLQALAPAVGLAEVQTSPPSSATHRVADAQDTFPRSPAPSAKEFQAVAPPVGLIEYTIPLRLVPTHRLADGHEMLLGLPTLRPARSVAVHAPAPPVGLVDVNSWPSLSSTAQNVVVGAQETSSGTPDVESCVGPVHALLSPVGLLDV